MYIPNKEYNLTANNYQIWSISLIKSNLFNL